MDFNSRIRDLARVLREHPDDEHTEERFIEELWTCVSQSLVSQVPAMRRRRVRAYDERDLVHEALVEVVERVTEKALAVWFEDVDDPRAYLQRVAHNALIDVRRQLAAVVPCLDVDRFAQNRESDPFDRLIREGQIATARDVLGRLSDRDRESLVLWARLGYSHFARRVGINENAARGRVFRARKRVLRLLNKMDGCA